MAFEDITDPGAVRRAIEEFEALGQARFLKQYGFGASRGWMLRDGDREYDAKPILGAAHGHQHPALGHLPYDQFHGGVPTARKLRELGFTVTEPDHRRNPVWSRDELILALDLYMRLRPSFPDGRHPEVVELSQLLNRLAAVTETVGSAKFRNGNGVAMKLQNFRRFDPSQEGRGLSGGGKGEEEVWAIFARDPERLRSAASAIRATVSALEEGPDQEPEDGAADPVRKRHRQRLDRGRGQKRDSSLIRACHLSRKRVRESSVKEMVAAESRRASAARMRGMPAQPSHNTQAIAYPGRAAASQPRRRPTLCSGARSKERQTRRSSFVWRISKVAKLTNLGVQSGTFLQPWALGGVLFRTPPWASPRRARRNEHV
jgi:hypothetical protein